MTSLLFLYDPFPFPFLVFALRQVTDSYRAIFQFLNDNTCTFRNMVVGPLHFYIAKWPSCVVRYSQYLFGVVQRLHALKPCFNTLHFI